MADTRPTMTALRASLLPSRPFVFLLSAWLLGLAFYAIFRLIFLFSFAEKATSVPISDILYAFMIGIRFDQIIILVVLAVPLLILPWLSLKRRAVQIATVLYISVPISFSFLLLLGDIPYYALVESHLNFLVLDYLSAGKTAWNLILTEPRLYLFVFIWGVATLFFVLILKRLISFSARFPHRRTPSAQAAFFVICIALTAVGIRGRIGQASIKWSVAYFSQNHFVNQLGLNPVYTLARALTEEGGDPRLSYLPESDRFLFVPLQQSLDSVRTWLGNENDHWLSPDSSLARTTTQPTLFGFRPNVVLVLLESWSGRQIDALGSSNGLTPCFDQLASEGILFTNCYANGTRSSYGMAATLCSFPSLPGRSAMTRYQAEHPFVAISELLHKRGYFNGFAYGGDLLFDNLEGFFTTKQYDRFWSEDYFGTENIFAKWGIPDHVVFDRTIPIVDSLPRPFQLTIFTLSNHEPFDLPDSSLQIYEDRSDRSRSGNALHYADYALGRFMDSMSRKPMFDSTLFVLVADHTHYAPSTLHIHPSNFHIPLLIYSPALIGSEGRRIDKVCSQVDLLPTLMSLLGEDYTHASWGRNILALPESDSGFAVLNVLNRVAIMEREFYYMEFVGQNSQLLNPKEIPERIRDISGEYPEINDRLRRRLHLYLQAAEQLSTPGMPTQ